MTITVIGTGFVGVVSSAVLASFGNRVYGLDIDVKKIASLTSGTIPFFEPGLEEMVKNSLAKGDLTFTTSYQEAVSDSDVVIIAVGTPSAPDGQADLKFVFAAIESLAPHLKNDAVVAIKSTVPPGTNAKVEKLITNHTQVTFHTASLPEFLKEGSAVQDTLKPDRVVIGAKDAFAIDILKELHKPIVAPVVVMSPESAQMCKYAANAYLATRITFINQLSNLCEVNGASILEVIEGIGYDRRVGQHYWYPGLAYGGSCFPKDVKELAAYSKAIGQDGNLLVKIDELNEQRPKELMDKYAEKVGGWENKVVTVLGLSFKPNTDDMREAPSTKVVPYLNSKNARVKAYDPITIPVAQKLYPSWNVEYISDPIQAISGSDVTLLLVEWPTLISLPIETICSQMKPGATFIDTRNQYAEKRQEFRSFGVQYIGVGLL